MSVTRPSRGRSVPFVVPAPRSVHVHTHSQTRTPTAGSTDTLGAVDEDTGFAVNPEALEILGRIRVPVAPIAVVGKYRTGKSFLLNKLIEHSGGFEVGPTVEACTKGIWLWSEPLVITKPDGSNIAVIFLDTEGIGAAGATAEHDARIFSLACLLCSVLVYNSVGAVDEEAVQNLSFIANLTQHIQLRSGAADKTVREGAALEDAASDESGSDEEDGDDDIDSDDDDYIADLKRAQRKKRAAAKRAQAARLREEMRRSAGMRKPAASTRKDEEGDADISTFFPSFLWVLRDFTLGLVDDDGQPMSPQDYLEMCLAQQEGFSSDAQTRNRTRRVLTNFFKERDCFTLVRPVEDESQLQYVDSLTEDELRPEFQRQLVMLRMKVLGDMVRAKTMQGQYVTGRILGGLAQAYVAAINAHAIPSIGNAWDGVSRVECKDALDAAYSSFAADLAAEVPSACLPLNQDELERGFEKHRIRAIDAFDAKAVGPSADKYRRELKEKLSADWKVLNAANAAASDASCARIIARLWHANVEPRLLHADEHGTSRTSPRGGSRSPADVYSNYEDFVADMTRVREDYLAEARGPAIHKALADFLLGAVPTVIRAINRARSAEIEKRLADINARLTALQEEVQLATARAKVFETQCADLRKERQTVAIERARFEQEARTAREEMEHLQRQITDLEAQRDDLTEKLRQERLAHAATRVAIKAGGDKGGAATMAAAAARPASPSVDLRAILGTDSGPVQVKDVGSKRSDAMLRMKPQGGKAEGIVSPTGGRVAFPEPPADGCGCTVM